MIYDIIVREKNLAGLFPYLCRRLLALPAVDQVQQRPVAQVLIDQNTSAVVEIPAVDSIHRADLNELTKIRENNSKF